MVSHQPLKFGGHMDCGSRDEGLDYTYPRFSPPLLFISEGHGLRAHGISN